MENRVRQFGNRHNLLTPLALAFVVACCFIAPACQNITSSEQLTIGYNRRGKAMAFLGPNPGGVPAQRGHAWHTMDISMENKCPAPVPVRPQDFRLHLASTPKAEGAESFPPTTVGLEHQPGRLRPNLLQPGQSLAGRLTFQVPNTLKNGESSDSSYHILRYPQPGSCPVTHVPY